MQTIESELLSIQQLGLRRSLKPLLGVDFCSNDYLGFARSEPLRRGLSQFMHQENPVGSTGSRLISGESQLVREVEDFLAQTFLSDSALIFGSGYLANLGVLNALGTEDAEFFSDELNHASLIDGMRLAKGKVQIFAHNDLQQLESLLAKSQAGRKIVVSESVFSMDGDTPDLSSLVRICDKAGAFLVVDEAHATGVCGFQGLGLMADLPHDHLRTIVVHTCGKALGAYGAFVTSSYKIRELIINKARSFIYSTALPPVLLQHIRIAINRSLEDPLPRQKLSQNLALIRGLFEQRGLQWRGSHVGHVLVAGNDAVIAVAEKLEKRDLQVKAIRSPTVKVGQERLRITLKAFHTPADLERLTNSLAEILVR